MSRRDKLAEVARGLGVTVPVRGVCPGHCTPLDYLERWYYERPPLSLVTGPRGGGKSYLSALATFLDSVRYLGHSTRVLGGSLAQSEQIYNALKGFSGPPTPKHLFRSITKTHAVLATGSDVSILAAAPTSVRGPHIPTLRLDEVDEIDPEIMDAAAGMCMGRGEAGPMIAMTSTWHKVGGPMGKLIDRAAAGELPAWTFCTFDVLERCPESRSGERTGDPDLYEHCPGCPIRQWCHSDVRPHPDTGRPEPKAKRSEGHYGIDGLIQKARLVSARAFEADYLCLGPKLDGLWFRGFDPGLIVTEDAEYDRRWPVGLGVDSGVWTGAEWFQVRGYGTADPTVSVFADFLSESRTARENAADILRVTEERCEGFVDWGYTDPAGGARNPIGPTVLAEYESVGLRLDPWPKPSVAESLNVLETLVNPAIGPPRLMIHPRCTRTIAAFQGYRRAKRQRQWMDWPEDPQHPHEDLIDALRGAVYAVMRGPSVSYGPDPTAGYRG